MQSVMESVGGASLHWLFRLGPGLGAITVRGGKPMSQPMRNSTLLAALGTLLLVSSAMSEGLESTPTEPAARGEYIANYVAQCVQCHSPHERNGDLTVGKHFEGQAMPFASPYPRGENWAPRAPVIKRLPGWSREDFVHLLMNGRRPDGHKPWSPMPQFRMSREDAAAVYAYLKSL